MREIRWICDWCKKIVVTTDDGENENNTYMPDGWIHYIGSETHWCGEKCLKASMTPEERERFEKSIWVA